MSAEIVGATGLLVAREGSTLRLSPFRPPFRFFRQGDETVTRPYRFAFAAGFLLAGCTALAQTESAEIRSKEAETWGPVAGFTTLSPMGLRPEHNSALFLEPERAYCPGGAGGFGLAQEALAEVQIPEGASLDYLELWGYDDEPTYGMTASLYEFCQGVGFDPPTTTLVGEL